MVNFDVVQNVLDIFRVMYCASHIILYLYIFMYYTLCITGHILRIYCVYLYTYIYEYLLYNIVYVLKHILYTVCNRLYTIR